MTKHHALRHLTPACLLLAFALPACSSDDAALTRAEYTKSANAACAKAEKGLEPIFSEIFPKLETATEAERQTATDGLLKVLGTEIDDLAALEPPDSIADKVDAMLASARKAEGIVRKQGAGFWLEEADPFADINKQAAALGLDTCASDSSE